MLLSFGMHIMEGFLPIEWAVAWFVIMLPFLYLSIVRARTLISQNPRAILLLAFAGAFTFVLSALKLPSVTGSCSHPTGMALGAILFGPTVMVLIGFIILLFQALLLAHGGLTTLGANVVSMAVIGPFIAYGCYTLLRKTRLPHWAAVLSGAALGSLSTYAMTATQLALAHSGGAEGFYAAFLKFMAVFAVTQVPIAIVEGILTVLVLDALWAYNRRDIEILNDLRMGGEQS